MLATNVCIPFSAATYRASNMTNESIDKDSVLFFFTSHRNKQEVPNGFLLIVRFKMLMRYFENNNYKNEMQDTRIR
jgi:hypothetical protein